MRTAIPSVLQDPVSSPRGPERAKAESGWRSSLRGDIAGGVTAAVLVVPGAAGLGILALSPLGDQYVSHGILAALYGAVFVPLTALALGVLFLVVFLAGLFQAAFGAFRLGTLVKYTPSPVMAGFQNAASILIFFAQVDPMLGFLRHVPLLDIPEHRGGFHPRSVPAHGAHSRKSRREPGRHRRRMVLPEHLAVDPGAARVGARPQGGQPGHRGGAGPALQLRHSPDGVCVTHPSPIPVGFWRSVGASLNTFGVESMIDELAAAALGNWGSAPPSGRKRGIAIGTAFNSIVAEVVEIGCATSTGITVNRVSIALDCYLSVNPGSIQAQLAGGMVHGLNAALYGQQTFLNWAAQKKNFNNNRMIRLNEMPDVAVTIIPSPAAADRKVNIGGVGELGVPTLAPALANAYFTLTGQRVRSLPFFPNATMGGL